MTGSTELKSGVVEVTRVMNMMTRKMKKISKEIQMETDLTMRTTMQTKQRKNLVHLIWATTCLEPN